MSRKWVNRYPPGSAFDGTADAALVSGLLALIGAALALTVLAHGLHLAVGTSTRTAVIAVAVLLGAFGGAAVTRLRHHFRCVPIRTR